MPLRLAGRSSALNRLPTIPLIGLDWGSTNVRAFAFDENGTVLATKRSGAGAMTLKSSDEFEAALLDLIGAWLPLRNGTRIIACGMVGARGAWVEAGYAPADASVDALRSALKSIATKSGAIVEVIPGLVTDEPDVMRGEETQIFGANVIDGTIVLPGTHSKWVQLKNGRIASFKTYFTGEMNALLRAHSAIGKALVSPPNLQDAVAINCGIAQAQDSGANWLHDLFAFRASVVAGALGEASASSELSAWLIASEFVQARQTTSAARTIHLIASDALLPWYQRIARAFDMEVIALDGEACVARGLWRIAKHD
jgi:2-dehydro-3-deoxygalactonokinase